LAEHNKYLIFIPERIKLSPRACMQFHKNVMQLERAPHRGSFRLGSKNAAKMSCS